MPKTQAAFLPLIPIPEIRRQQRLEERFVGGAPPRAETEMFAALHHLPLKFPRVQPPVLPEYLREITDIPISDKPRGIVYLLALLQGDLARSILRSST